MNIYAPGSEYNTQGPCDTGFHIPLAEEWQAVYDAGVSLGAWTSSTPTSMLQYLRLPPAGYRGGYNDANVANANSESSFWTASYNYTGFAKFFQIYKSSNINGISSGSTNKGCPIRAFRDEPVSDITGWSKVYSGTGTAGIYWNSSLGLITLSADGNTWYTIADKNLGATTTYSYGDSISASNCGNFYQRGNNFGFASTGTIGYNNSWIDASGYGPGHWYIGSIFRIKDSEGWGWDSSYNDNLWGGSNPVTAMKEVQNIYIGEAPQEPITTSGIYWNESKGLISLSSDGSNWITIADKNLGATTVRNNGDTQTSSNSGKFYQWGNNYGFNWGSNPSSTITKANATGYGPGNYYSSSTFIKNGTGTVSNPGWSSVENTNLWGNTTNTLVARKGPCDEGWHVPTSDEFTSLMSTFNTIEGGYINWFSYLKTGKPGRIANDTGRYENDAGVYWWSSTPDSSDTLYSVRTLYTYTSSNVPVPTLSTAPNSRGFVIRPFKNEAVQPTSKWTKLN